MPRINESDLLAKVPTGLLIDGVWRPAADGSTVDVLDPATGRSLLTVASATTADGLDALAACGPRSCDAPSTC